MKIDPASRRPASHPPPSLSCERNGESDDKALQLANVGDSGIRQGNSRDEKRRGSGRPTSRRQTNKPAPRLHKAYKPTPLRWPFLVLTGMVLLAAALAVIMALQGAMPNSDSSAIVDGQHVARRAADSSAASAATGVPFIPSESRKPMPPPQTELAEPSSPPAELGGGKTGDAPSPTAQAPTASARIAGQSGGAKSDKGNGLQSLLPPPKDLFIFANCW
jgi:hypothetical protein